MSYDVKLAVQLFEDRDYKKSFDIFWHMSMFYHAGYCKFAQAHFAEADKIWTSFCNDSPAVNWGLSIIQLANLTIPKNLTFFQIRNFLERDLSLLMENGHFAYVENIISSVAILYEFNPEVYKFIARVLLNSGYHDVAKDFLMKAHSICYNDAEVHYLLARYYLAINNIQAAVKTLKIALEINPQYFPIKNLLGVIQLDCSI